MSSLVEYIKGFRKAAKPGAEDITDHLNFVWTPMLLILCSLVVFGKEFVGRPMHCVFSGNQQHHPNGFLDFSESYCWAHGTYRYSKNGMNKLTGFKDFNEQESYWESTMSDKLLTYYQWVPFALLLQCAISYLPKVIWQMICSHRFGSDIYSLVRLAAEAQTSTDRCFREQASRIADIIERMLVYNREFRHGRLQRLKSAVYNRCSFLVPSKRMGTMLTLLYILVKLLCLANAIGQLLFMSAFLGFQQQGLLTYGWVMVLHAGRNVQVPALFPLHTLCYISLHIDPGSSNAYIGQCTLPVNILNEKIYVILFFWFLIMGSVTLINIGTWLFRLVSSCNRVAFVKRFLRLSDPHLQPDHQTVKAFISKFLRHDGVFLVLMLSQGSDKVITTEVVRQLYQRWRGKLRGCDLSSCYGSNVCSATTDKVAAADCAAVEKMPLPLPANDDIAGKMLHRSSNVYGIAGADESGLLSV